MALKNYRGKCAANMASIFDSALISTWWRTCSIIEWSSPWFYIQGILVSV